MDMFLIHLLEKTDIIVRSKFFTICYNLQNEFILTKIILKQIRIEYIYNNSAKVRKGQEQLGLIVRYGH
jgi:hypothetical protein